MNFTLKTSTGVQVVTATKYNVRPRSAPFKATLDGRATDAWTTEGRGAAYLYWLRGDDLFYAKVLATDLIAARVGLVIESEGYAPKSKAAANPKPARVPNAKAHV